MAISKFIVAEEAMDVAPGGPRQQEDEHNDAGSVGPLGGAFRPTVAREGGRITSDDAKVLRLIITQYKYGQQITCKYTRARVISSEK